ncbi:MAG: biopolymer transporter ExbD [Planctomycetota bacterium]|nr:biopolymer transporter ExbD [Planctomycetota bacterium]
MPLKTESIEETNLNLTPMIDIVFLLIIFFMVGTQFSEMERQFDIQLPTVDRNLTLTSLPDPLIVNIDGEGQVKINNKSMSLEQLQVRLITAQRNYADQIVLIRGQGAGPYQHVMDIIEICQQAKIKNVSLANRVKTSR